MEDQNGSEKGASKTCGSYGMILVGYAYAGSSPMAEMYQLRRNLWSSVPDLHRYFQVYLPISQTYHCNDLVEVTEYLWKDIFACALFPPIDVDPIAERGLARGLRI
jgi:hypothetical protein